MTFRAAGDFEAAFTGPLLIPAVPIRGQFESLFGHVSLAMAVRITRSFFIYLCYEGVAIIWSKADIIIVYYAFQ